MPPSYRTLVENVSCFLTFLTGEIQASSIEIYFAGVRKHILTATHGVVDLSLDFHLQRLRAGIKRSMGEGKPSSAKAPVLPQHLRAILALMRPDSLDLDLRDFTLFVVSLFGFLRRSEAAALQCADVTFFDTHVELCIRKSKTSLENATVVLSKRADALCPVFWLRKYLSRLPAQASALFVAVRRGKLSTLPISKNVVSSQLKEWLSLAGIDASLVSGHSLRRGGATAAAIAGVPDSLIKMHGRWKSNAYLLYVIPSLDKKLEVSSFLA